MSTSPQRLIVHLSVRDAARAIEFYVRALGAAEEFRLTEPGGKVGHAELTVGGARFMIADEYPDHGFLGPESLGGTTVTLSLAVDDADAAAARAIAAGAPLLRPIKTEFFGERVASLRDPFGHRWSLTQVVETVAPDEMQRRFAAMTSG